MLLPIPAHIPPDAIDDVPEDGPDGSPCIAIDDEIAPAVLALWEAGIVTTYSCGGHGTGVGVVIVVTGDQPDPGNWSAVFTRDQIAAIRADAQGQTEVRP